MGHSKTPWKVQSMEQFHSAGEFGIEIVSADGNVIADNQTYYPAAISEPDARRIVACVNACAGLDTDYLENVGLPEFVGKTLCADLSQQELDAVIAQRDQLKALSVENILIGMTPGHDGMGQEAYAKSVDDVVALLTELSGEVDELEIQRDQLQSQLEAERASLFAESQRKQQLEQQRDELLAVLEGLLDEVAGCMCTYEMPARAVIQKVRGGE